jgi:hypothetical protein
MLLSLPQVPVGLLMEQPQEKEIQALIPILHKNLEREGVFRTSTLHPLK